MANAVLIDTHIRMSQTGLVVVMDSQVCRALVAFGSIGTVVALFAIMARGGDVASR